VNMEDKMKILIGYDGSECSTDALDDLKNAGLPAMADVLVMSIADVFVPPPINEEIDNTFPMYVPAGIKRAHERAAKKLGEAEAMAKRAANHLHNNFPNWEIRYEALADSPAWAILRSADKWQADLIVVGATGHNVLGGRLILGSISQRILYEAACSVRIARHGSRNRAKPLRLLVGVDNSEHSKRAVAWVGGRHWPAGTEVRLLAVVDTVMEIPSEPNQPADYKWIEVGDEENWEQVRSIFQPSADQLQALGLDAAVMIRRGNPKTEILEEAESWKADCIFVGAKGMRGIDRLLLGSVSSSVSARAHCSVEVVRPETKRAALPSTP
jgi:nucleotide-binding universal stress UspA family protein